MQMHMAARRRRRRRMKIYFIHLLKHLFYLRLGRLEQEQEQEEEREEEKKYEEKEDYFTSFEVAIKMLPAINMLQVAGTMLRLRLSMLRLTPQPAPPAQPRRAAAPHRWKHQRPQIKRRRALICMCCKPDSTTMKVRRELEEDGAAHEY